jgi:hypothetical protein
MNEEMETGDDPRKDRRLLKSRPRTPRATHAPQSRKSPTTGYGGAHRRRNKHWNW